SPSARRIYFDHATLASIVESVKLHWLDIKIWKLFIMTIRRLI
ncbi:7989_t:CDS:1, partial [Gigaspora margarita]